MIKSNRHIEIVRSNVTELSSMSIESCNSILAVLSKHFSQVGVTNIDSFSDLEKLSLNPPDLVFLGMEYICSDPSLGQTDPNKIWLSDYLEALGIAYTGSSQLAHEFGRNKPLAKKRVAEANLATPDFYVIERKQLLDAITIPISFPVFVKPANRGGGLGVDSDSVVRNYDQLKAKVSSITNELQSDALIEEYLPGREFSVSILKDEHSGAYLALPIELVAPADDNGARLLSGDIKSSNAEQALAVVDIDLKTKINSLALEVFNALGARDFGRIDIRLDKSGKPYFLEANLIPSLISGYGSFPKACILNIGMDYEAMIMRIVKLGLARQVKEELIPDPTLIIDPLYPTPEVAIPI